MAKKKADKNTFDPSTFVPKAVLEKCPGFLGGVTLKDGTELAYEYTTGFFRRLKTMTREVLTKPAMVGRTEEAISVDDLEDEESVMVYLYQITMEARQQHEHLKDIGLPELFELSRFEDFNRLLNEYLYVWAQSRPKREILDLVS